MYVEVSNVKRSVGHPFRVNNLLGTSAKVEKSLDKKVLTPIMYLSPWKSLQNMVFSNPRVAEMIGMPGIHDTGSMLTSIGRDLVHSVLKHRGGKHYLANEWKFLEKIRKFNACEYACSCPRVCLALTAGRLRYTDSQIFEALKTLMYIANKEDFYEDLTCEIHALQDKVARGFTKNGVKYNPGEVELHVRLNGGSDLDWYSDWYSPIRYFERMDNAGLKVGSDRVQFFDYTKDYYRMGEYLDGDLTQFPKNYHLTYSAGSRDEWTADIMKQGGNVAVVFREFPEDLIGTKTHAGYTFIDGTAHDARALDPKRSIVCLKPLGWPAKKDKTSRFMFNNAEDFLSRVGKHLEHSVESGRTMTVQT